MQSNESAGKKESFAGELMNLAGEAWEAYHVEAILLKTKLANTPLIKACLLTGDDPRQRVFAVRAALLWSLEQLQNSGKTAWIAQAEVLRLRFIENYSVDDAIDKIQKRLQTDVPRETFFYRQRAGIKKTDGFLKEEMRDPVGQARYRQRSLELRIDDIGEEPERRLLRLLSILRKPIQEFSALFLTIDTDGTPLASTHALEKTNLVQRTGKWLEIHAEVRDIVALQVLVSRQEEIRFHQAAAQFYERERDYVEAIYHWQQIQAYDVAAKLLLEHHARLGTDDMLKQLKGFKRPTVSADRWSRLKLLEGQLIEQQEKLDEAMKVYESALGADNPRINAEVYQRFAHLYIRKQEIKDALDHSNLALEMLNGLPQTDAVALLLVEIYISRSWVYIEQRRWDEATQDLARCEAFFTDPLGIRRSSMHWLQLRSDWHTAWGGYAHQHNQFAESESHKRHAWLFANQTHDTTRILRTGYNLALVYIRREKFAEAKERLLDTHKLAEEEGNKRMVALCNKQLGAWYALNGEQYRQAIPLYKKAYHFFKQRGHARLLVMICYDLAEANIELGELTEALTYLDEGETLTSPSSYLHGEFRKLRERYVEISAEYTPRQRQIIREVRIHGKINRAACAKLLGISSRQALRELTELVERDQLLRRGQARGTHYVLHGGDGLQN